MVHLCLIYRCWRHMTDYAGPRDYVENLLSPWRTAHTDPHPPLRKMIPTCRDRLRPSRCCASFHNRISSLPQIGSLKCSVLCCPFVCPVFPFVLLSLFWMFMLPSIILSILLSFLLSVLLFIILVLLFIILVLLFIILVLLFIILVLLFIILVLLFIILSVFLLPFVCPSPCPSTYTFV